MISKKCLFKTAVAVTAGVTGLSYAVYREVIERDAKIIKGISNMMDKKENGDKPIDPREAWLRSQKFNEFVLIDEKGEKLKGHFLKAEEQSDVYVLLSHGYRSCGKDEYKLITKYYHDKGVNVLLVDHTASGESEGKYIGFGYYEKTACMSWVDFLIRQFGKDIKIILHGISMGSATVMLMSGEESLPENVKFTVADCGYTSAMDEFKYCLSLAHIPAFPMLNIVRFITEKKAGYDLRDTNSLYAVTHAKVPMLFIHGGADDFVPVYMQKLLYDACVTEKDILTVEGAWHAQSYPTYSEAYEEKINEFYNRYIK